MGAFVKAVQDEVVPGPLLRAFKLDNWEVQFRKHEEDDEDLCLYEAGKLIYEKACSIRSSLSVTFSKEIEATTKIRAFVAVTNHNHTALEKIVGRAFREVADAGGDAPVMMHELLAKRFALLAGGDFSPNEIIQSMVDGLQVPIKRILEVGPCLRGMPKFGKIDWVDVLTDFNLAVMYSLVEGLWEDCLWNGYRPGETDGILTFTPDKDVWPIRSVVSRFRGDNLATQFTSMALTIQKEIVNSGGRFKGPFQDVRAVAKEGKRQVIRLSPPGERSDGLVRRESLRLFASEPYYTELLQEPRDVLGGATLDQVMTAWTIASRVAELLKEETLNQVSDDSDASQSWLPSFCPVIQVQALTRAVATNCGVSVNQAEILIDFLTYQGGEGQELWAQPLVPISEKSVTPVFSAIFSPNLRRLVDVWLRQLNVDLGLRGPAFEAYIRSAIRRDITDSKLLSGAQLLDHSLRFCPAGDREEEIDIILVIGELLIVGEAKCFLEPAEPKQTAMHRVKVIEAAAQAKRKAENVTRNINEFRTRLDKLGVKLKEHCNVLPVVILNGPIHAGFKVDGVPVVDENILGVFFRGELIDMSVQNPAGDFRHIAKRVLYDSFEEAANRAAEFFGNPPQMDILNQGVEKRWVPIPKVSDDDWPGTFMAFDCSPRVELPESL